MRDVRERGIGVELLDDAPDGSLVIAETDVDDFLWVKF